MAGDLDPREGSSRKYSRTGSETNTGAIGNPSGVSHEHDQRNDQGDHAFGFLWRGQQKKESGQRQEQDGVEQVHRAPPGHVPIRAIAMMTAMEPATTHAA